MGAFGLMGWRQSSRKLAGVESARQAIAHDLAVHQAELERIKFSEARLRNANLNTFLYSDHTEESREPSINAAAKVGADVNAPRSGAVYATLSEPPSQTFSPGLGQPLPIDSNRTAHLPNHSPGSEPLDQLLKQLHQLSEQVEELRGGSGNRLAA
ncbi:MAG: hypothetical protein EA368_06725 [Leptolyngbya sp. DLM2.Bin27]|nr:MAG: hypothetical protein EA368_06725 [Leptolyngbya sp. DLM2.Bin27]